MPHCQKEKHNHAAKSKKERQQAKQELVARKKKLQEEQARVEAEAVTGALRLGNNIAPVEGHGAYEIGCAPEPEIKRFNAKKRSKKHLRQDLRKRELQEAREAEERRQQQREEEYRLQQSALREASGAARSDEEEEEEVRVLEYFVFLCECCDKRYATKNQFLNHVKSKKHKSKVRIYEDLGLLCTHVELRGVNGNDKESYDDDEQEDDDDNSIDQDDNKDDGNRNVTKDDSDNEEESESEEEYVAPKRKDYFTAFAAGFSSSSEDEDSDDNGDDPVPPPAAAAQKKDPEKKDEEDMINFDDLMEQNRLIQHELNANKTGTTALTPRAPSLPVPFDETYDAQDYGVNEHRLVSVRHRLRKNLAAQGVAPREATAAYDPLQAVVLGKTLLQQVLEADVGTLQHKLDAYDRHKKQCALVCREFASARGNSKALPSQYVFRQDAADDARQRANVHHAGSHYHMQAARSMQFGRRQGLSARHSSQGARLQAQRTEARLHGGGGTKKIVGKKSHQKKRGEAGGSKKSGGGGD